MGDAVVTSGSHVMKGGRVGGAVEGRDPGVGVNCCSGQGAVVWLGAERNGSRWCGDTAET